MLQGLRTVICHAADLQRAKAWYAQVIGHAPYFDRKHPHPLHAFVFSPPATSGQPASPLLNK